MLQTRVAGLVLAGGEGRRLAKDKGWREVGGVPIIQRVLRAVTLVAQRTVVVGDCALPETAGVRQVRDETPGAGPLAATLTGMRRAPADRYLVVAWDMPFVTAEFLRYLLEEAEGADAVVPNLAARDHPLCALYSADCRSPIAEALGRGNRRMDSIFNRVEVKRLSEPLLARFGDPRHLLMNVNTPEDLELANQIAAHREAADAQ